MVSSMLMAAASSREMSRGTAGWVIADESPDRLLGRGGAASAFVVAPALADLMPPQPQRHPDQRRRSDR